MWDFAALRILFCIILVLLVPAVIMPSTSAQPMFMSGWKKGRETGLPIPRFVSIKAKTARMRVGPGTAYQIIWVYSAPALPIEILAEYGHWRQVRDSTGSSGWMYAALLSGRRTGLVAPWAKTDVMLYRARSLTAAIVAQLQPDVRVRLYSCDGSWCEVSVAGDPATGFIKQSAVWGAYPGEIFH